MERPQGEEVQVRILLNLLNMVSRDSQFIGFMRYWHHVIYTDSNDSFSSDSILLFPLTPCLYELKLMCDLI